MANTYRYFMSANGYGGFTSIYDSIQKEAGTLYVLKGGPGCGKSGFMKRIGSACTKSGVDVEYIHCAGDPDSIDGVIIPELGCAFADGTRPHVLEPDIAGCTGGYIDLGAFCDSGEIAECRGEIEALEKERQRMVKRAGALVTAAGKAVEGVLSPLHTVRAIETAEKRAAGISGREMKRSIKGKSGKTKHRYISAFTCRGLITLADTVIKQCDRIYTVDNRLGLGEYLLRYVSERAALRGYDTVTCMSPFEYGKPEALIVPGHFAVVTGQPEKYEAPYRHIRLDAAVNRELLEKERVRIKRAEKLRKEALVLAQGELASAKALHDRIEEIYNPFVDFEGVAALADRYAEGILRR